MDELRMLIADIFINLAVRLYPKGEAHTRLCYVLLRYFDWSINLKKYDKYR